MPPQVTQHLRSVTRSNLAPLMGKPPDLLRFLYTPAFLLSCPQTNHIRCICTQLSVAQQAARKEKKNYARCHRLDTLCFLMGRHYVTELLCFYPGQHKPTSEFLGAVYSHCPNSSPTLISITIRLTIVTIKHIYNSKKVNKTNLLDIVIAAHPLVPRVTSWRSTAAQSPPLEQLRHTFWV